jgi:DNA segregation ATPase FtsK/SpoIIIE, S-DNA-T family
MFQEKEENEVSEQTIVNETKSKRNDTKGKSLDTKVTYQYPKGKFRFPLISDEKEEKLPSNRVRPKRENLSQNVYQTNDNRQQEQEVRMVERPRREQRVPLNGHARQEHRNSVNERSRVEPRIRVRERNDQDQVSSDPKRIFSQPKNPVHKPETKNEIQSKIVKKGSRPFQPTEIPSPIYGFTKRPILSEVVEFELESEVDRFSQVNQTANHVKKPVEVFYDEAVTTNRFEAEVLEELNIIEPDYTSYSFNKVDIEIEDKVQRFADELIDEKLERIDQTSEEFLEEKLEEEYSAEEYSNGESSERLSDETEIIVSNDEQILSDFDVPTSPESKVEASPFVPKMEVEEKVEISTVEEEKKPTGRSHLPFNVLMLKQDKRKWEQHRIEQAMQKEKEESAALQEKKEIQAVKTEPSVEGKDFSYDFPGFDLLNPPMTRFAQENVDWIDNQEYLLNEALKNFGVRASVVNITQGPSVTRFEVQPEPGVKVNKITNLSDDIKLSLAAKDIRIEAPIPGKHTIGIEVPNKKSRPVLISEIIKSEAFLQSSSPLTAVLGLDISGAPVVTDLKKMPHGLIAGATGSGKSVCINSILVSLLYKASPQELKLLLIDPKMVELAPYNHIPHLVSPVITDVKAATAALKWAVDEMERRYELFAHAGVRDITRFNEIADAHKRYSEKLPFIVIIIDELADLMMMSPADVEESICRIAQKARACGIHLIVATQRPSVDVITGLIKANVPTRTAFSVSSQIDSRTIIDISGAEKLLGRGDMLFLENGSSKPVRLQGTFVSDAEIDLVVEHVRNQQEPQYLFHQEELLKKAQTIEDEDELFYEACEFVIDQGGASTSSLQRRFKIGYNRAARLIDLMEQQGFISEPKGSKPRDVLITEEELEQLQESTSSTFI